MRVTVVSIHAALAGRDEITWTGNVTADDLGLAHGPNPTDEAMRERINDALFRCFNRVDPIDEQRLDAIGYRLPSLSVGDLIHWERQTFRVAGLGFERITGSEDYVVALAAYALRSAAEAPEDEWMGAAWERVRRNDRREFDETGKARVTDPNEPR
jgi:hypothetical protein